MKRQIIALDIVEGTVSAEDIYLVQIGDVVYEYTLDDDLVWCLNWDNVQAQYESPRTDAVWD